MIFLLLVPDSYDELQTLLEPHNPEYQSVILERMIKCNHPSLGEQNKMKLQNLFAYLLQFLHDTASSDMCNNGPPMCFVVLDRIAHHLYDLAQVSAENAKKCLVEVLKEKQDDFKRMRKRRYPGLDTVCYFYFFVQPRIYSYKSSAIESFSYYLITRVLSHFTTLMVL